MKTILLSVLLLAPWIVTAQETDPSGGIFDFSDLDVPPAEVPKEDAAEKQRAPEENPLAGYPDEVRKVLEKLAGFEAAKQAGTLQQITAGRKIAAEILTQRAAAADATARAALLERAGQVESLPPEQSLDAGPKKVSPAVDAFLGVWKTTTHDWVFNFVSDGKIFEKGKVSGQWSVLDEKKGFFLLNFNSGTATLFQFDKPAGATRGRIVYTWGGPVGIVKQAAAAPVAVVAGANDPVAQLAASEAKQREALDTLIQSKHLKVAKWLLQLAPNLRGEQARLVVERAAQLEKKLVPQLLQPGPELGGVWQWQGKALEFKEGGTVMLGSYKSGTWRWGRDDHGVIIFFLDAQSTAGVASKSGRDPNRLRMNLLKGGNAEAKRK